VRVCRACGLASRLPHVLVNNQVGVDIGSSDIIPVIGIRSSHEQVCQYLKTYHHG
jgi:hypothetical protein